MGTTIGIGVGIGLGNIGISTWTPQNFNLVVEGHSFVNPGTALSYFMKDYINVENQAYDQNNLAAGGNTIATMAARAASVDALLVTETATLKNLLPVYIGSNDINNTAGTGTTAYNALKPYIQARAAAGWKVPVFTDTKKGNDNAQGEIERTTFNNLLRTDLSQTANVFIIDTDTIAELDDPANAIYYSDTLHPTDVGAFLINQLFVAKIASLYSTGALPVEEAATPTSLLLTKVGTGAGVSTLTMRTRKDVTITLGANATFYSDAGGTANPSQTWTILKGVNRTIYLKCTTGTATFGIDKNEISEWTHWITPANAPVISASISTLTRLARINIQGDNSLTCDISLLLKLWYAIIWGNSNFSGDISVLTGLQYVNPTNSNTFTASRVIDLKVLCYLVMSTAVTISTANVNQLLADFWANKDTLKKITNRTIHIAGNAASGAPSGQGITDKAALQGYKSPNNTGPAVWVVTTR